jgi:hypothetical protein
VLAITQPDDLAVGFRRPDAALHVIFISDGDDESGAVLGADPAGAFVSFLEDEAARTGRIARASAVVGDVPGGCSGPGGEALPGTRYAQVADTSGGRTVSICTSDYGDVVDAVGDVGVEWTTVFPLQAQPAEGSVVVTVDGTRMSDGWVLDPEVPALVFDVPPAPDASIEVRYLLPAEA